MPVRRPDIIENLLLKPYFWRRPSQILRRIRWTVRVTPGAARVRLPWGLAIECDPSEMIGKSLIRTGIFEIVTTEALVRLVDPGELVLDVGANIGYMTSLLACAAGPSGRVVAYEPNPEVYERLVRNVRLWDPTRLAEIALRQVALSEREGTAPLTIPEGRSEWAAVGERPLERANAATHTTVEVPTVTLDGELGDQCVGVLKLDVEDHEPAVLIGARMSLERKRIRDILFEDHGSYPSETTRTLERRDYSVFDLAATPNGVALHASSSRVDHASWDAPMRLATLDPARAHERLSTRGWLSLGRPARWSKASGRRR